MNRALAYRSKPSVSFEETKSTLQETTLYLVARNGPTLFSLKDDKNITYKVVIGNPHTCTCGNNTEELCIHQIFCLIKVLRIPESHQLCYQLGLTDNETGQVLDGLYSINRNNRKCSNTSRERRNGRASRGSEDDKDISMQQDENSFNGIKHVLRQDITDEEEHICPICQDEVTASQALTWCRKGCGNNIHATCMQTFAQYKVSNREAVVCPLCREDWSIELLRDDCRGKASLKNSCIPVSCYQCKDHIKNNIFFRCVECSNNISNLQIIKKLPDYCANCFNGIGHEHGTHHFVSSDTSIKVPSDINWQAVKNPRRSSQPLVDADVLRSLEGRELTVEDYDLLLNLDSNECQDFATHIISSLIVYDKSNSYNSNRTHNDSSSSSDDTGSSCSNVLKRCWCNRETSLMYGEVTALCRLLPCKHIGHDSCIKLLINRASSDNNSSVSALTCSHPACKVKIFPGLNRKRKKKSQPRGIVPPAANSAANATQNPIATSPSTPTASMSSGALTIVGMNATAPTSSHSSSELPGSNPLGTITMRSVRDMRRVIGRKLVIASNNAASSVTDQIGTLSITSLGGSSNNMSVPNDASSIITSAITPKIARGLTSQHHVSNSVNNAIRVSLSAGGINSLTERNNIPELTSTILRTHSLNRSGSQTQLHLHQNTSSITAISSSSSGGGGGGGGGGGSSSGSGGGSGGSRSNRMINATAAAASTINAHDMIVNGSARYQHNLLSSRAAATHGRRRMQGHLAGLVPSISSSMASSDHFNILTTTTTFAGTTA